MVQAARQVPTQEQIKELRSKFNERLEKEEPSGEFK